RQTSSGPEDSARLRNCQAGMRKVVQQIPDQYRIECSICEWQRHGIGGGTVAGHGTIGKSHLGLRKVHPEEGALALAKGKQVTAFPASHLQKSFSRPYCRTHQGGFRLRKVWTGRLPLEVRGIHVRVVPALGLDEGLLRHTAPT